MTVLHNAICNGCKLLVIIAIFNSGTLHILHVFYTLCRCIEAECAYMQITAEEAPSGIHKQPSSYNLEQTRLPSICNAEPSSKQDRGDQ